MQLRQPKNVFKVTQEFLQCGEQGCSILGGLLQQLQLVTLIDSYLVVRRVWEA